MTTRSLRFIERSRDPFLGVEGKDDGGAIFLVQQFYLDAGSAERRAEVRFCLRANVANRSLSRIFLLNERLFSARELLGEAGEEAEAEVDAAEAEEALAAKVTQVVVGARLTFGRAFEFVAQAREEAHLIWGADAYVVLANADVLFDADVARVRRTDLREGRKLFALARTEMQHRGLFASTHGVFNRFDSQDAWILHASFARPPHIPAAFRDKALDFPLGVPGCDNKLLYLLCKLRGFEAYNTPLAVRAYHCHRGLQRGGQGEQLPFPYAFCAPAGLDVSRLAASFGVDLAALGGHKRGSDNALLRGHISHRLAAGKAFVVPRFLGGPAELWDAKMCLLLRSPAGERRDRAVAALLRLVPDRDEEAAGLLQLAAQAGGLFSDCMLALGHDSLHVENRRAAAIQNSVCSLPQQRVLSRDVLELYHHHRARDPHWSSAFRWCRLLLVVDGEDLQRLVEAQWAARALVFPEPEDDFFPQCAAKVACFAPDAQGLPSFQPHVGADDFQVALVCLGDRLASHAACHHVFRALGRSAINVGEALLPALGIASPRFVADRPDVFRLHVNQHWKVLP